MHKPISISSSNRKIGKHQVDEQRNAILDAAEKLFLHKGLENTSMVDIARQAGITKVTLYRYFENRNAIAVEIHVRMIRKIAAMNPPEEHEPTLEHQKLQIRSMIRNYPALREAYRYIGMFDKIYLDNPPDAALTQWTKNQLVSMKQRRTPPGEAMQGHPYENERAVILNTVIWFLEKLALRGELTWSQEGVPLEVHLKIFEDMILSYFDRIGNSKKDNV